MINYHGSMRLEQVNGRVELTFAEGSTSQRHEFDLPAGFTLADVQEALAATGLAECQAGTCQLLAPVNGGQVRDWLVQMLACFRRPGEPIPRLALVMDAVNEHPLAPENVPIPVWAYAWLDILVRDELADAARTSEAIWEDDELTLDLVRLRDRRIRELILRYAPVATAGSLAPSSRTRPGQSRATG